MTDQQKIRMLVSVLLGNQIAWIFTTMLFNQEHKRLVKEYDAMKKLAVGLTELADETDPRVQQAVSDWQFGTMTRETLSDLEKGWKE